MERIKEAVERARKERRQAGDTARRRTTDIDFRRFRVPEQTPRAGEVHSIVSSENRIHELDPRHLEKNRIVAANNIDSRAIAFDMLRTKILSTMNENGWRTLGITSPTPDCGKTTVAINLAISIARQPDHGALLVDFDLRKPKVRRYLGLPRENSLYDCIKGRCTINEALINPGIPRFGVLANTRPVARASEMLSGSDVRELVGTLRNRNDRSIVMFDLPPALSTDDTIAFLPQIDCILLVIASGVTTKVDVEECKHVLAPTNLVGIALNKADDYHISSY